MSWKCSSSQAQSAWVSLRGSFWRKTSSSVGFQDAIWKALGRPPSGQLSASTVSVSSCTLRNSGAVSGMPGLSK